MVSSVITRLLRMPVASRLWMSRSGYEVVLLNMMAAVIQSGIPSQK